VIKKNKENKMIIKSKYSSIIGTLLTLSIVGCVDRENAEFSKLSNTGFAINTYIPADGASDVDGHTPNITAIFSQTITAQSGKNIEIWQKRATTNGIHAQYGVTLTNVNVSGATLSDITIPFGHLAYGKDYFIKIDAGAFKNANNEEFTGITDATTWNFSTSATSGPCGCPSFDNCDLPVDLQ
jgi:hypothetical protein